GHFPLARPAAPVPADGAASPARARFAVGDAVSVRDIHPAGHTRVPRYVRGKRGVVLHVAPAFVFPDLAGHGHRARREHTYHVEFRARELWPDGGGGDSAVVDLWESYLEAAP